jgi:hypothetical protein
MKRKLCALPAALLIAPLALAQGGAPDVEVRQLAEHSYELVLKTRRSKDVAQGQKELLPTAKGLCGALGAQLGGYQYSVSEPLLTGAAASGAEPQSSWTPSEAEKTQVVLLTQRYFSLMDSGDLKAAYALTSPEMRQGVSLERWSILGADFAAHAGEVKNRTIRKITWYKDPPDAQARGVFAAVDHAGSFQNIGIHCGYLMWHQQADGSFKLFRKAEHSVDKKTESRMSAEQVAAARKAHRC